MPARPCQLCRWRWLHPGRFCTLCSPQSLSITGATDPPLLGQLAEAPQGASCRGAKRAFLPHGPGENPQPPLHPHPPLQQRTQFGSWLCGRQRPDLTPCYPGLLQPSPQGCTSLTQFLEGEFLPAFCSWPGQVLGTLCCLSPIKGKPAQLDHFGVAVMAISSWQGCT